MELRPNINKLLLPLCSVFCALIVSSCALIPTQEIVLATVDGEPVTEGDLGYALNIAHRREDLSTTKKLDIPTYVQKLIDDRLIMQEARRMGMEDSPDIQGKIRDFVLRESVVKLYNEEIVNRVSVTEEDIVNYYRENYERFTLNVIEASDEDTAAGILEKLKSGEAFEEYAKEFVSQSTKESGIEHIVTKKTLRPVMQEAVSDLKPGEISSVIKDQDKYYILKLIGRQDAPEEELQNVRESIKNILNDQKIKERSDEYLAQLREKTSIKIDRDLLASIEVVEGGKTREDWLNNKSPLAVVDDITLTAGEFTAMLSSTDMETKEKVLNKWLERKIVDIEALSRHYEGNPDLNVMVQRYKNELVKNMFSRTVIMPGIQNSEKSAEEYYLSHREEFVKPDRYRIQQITLSLPEDAQEVLNSLQGGANFSWLAKTKSTDTVSAAGGVLGWRTREELDEPVRKIIDTLKPGDVSPVLMIDDAYRIVRLMEKSENEVEGFSKVKGAAFNAAYKEKYYEIYNEYIDKLKKDARIELNEKNIRAFEKTLEKK